MYRSEPRLQWLSLILLVVLFPHLLGFTVQQGEAWPLKPNMEVERKRKNQSLSSSTFAALVKEQCVPNKGETPGPRGPPVIYATPPHFRNHEMSASPRVHGDEYVPLAKGPVPPSALTQSHMGLDAIGNH